MNSVTTPQASRLKGRPALFDSDRVEEQVADLFWARGYDGVSISDITSATGLSKSSLYNSFGGKDDLFRKALTRYHKSTVQAGADWLAADDEADPMEKLDQLLRGPADDVHGRDDTRGCFLCNTSADGLGRAPDIDTLVGRLCQTRSRDDRSIPTSCAHRAGHNHSRCRPALAYNLCWSAHSQPHETHTRRIRFRAHHARRRRSTFARK